MDWQLGVVAFLVAGASLYLLRRALRTWSDRGGGCGKGCGSCAPVPKETPAGRVAFIPSDQLTLRRDPR